MQESPQELRAEVYRLVAEARRTADSVEKTLLLSRAMELAGKAEVLENQLRGYHPDIHQKAARKEKTPPDQG